MLGPYLEPYPELPRGQPCASSYTWLQVVTSGFKQFHKRDKTIFFAPSCDLRDTHVWWVCAGNLRNRFWDMPCLYDVTVTGGYKEQFQEEVEPAFLIVTAGLDLGTGRTSSAARPLELRTPKGEGRALGVTKETGVDCVA